MPPSEKLKHKLKMPEKLKRKLLTPSQTRAETDRGNSICPFHHSSNGGPIKSLCKQQAADDIFLYFSEKIRLDISCLVDHSHKMPSLIFSEK